MMDAAMTAVIQPWQISFKVALQLLNQFLPLLDDAPSVDLWMTALLKATATHKVGDRPNRYEHADANEN